MSALSPLGAPSSTTDDRRPTTDDGRAAVWRSSVVGRLMRHGMAVCPAGEDVIAPFLRDRKGFLAEVVKPLQQKLEPIYVTAASDAERHVQKRFPHKTVRRVGNSLRPTSINNFLSGLPLLLKRHWADGLDLTASVQPQPDNTLPTYAEVAVLDMPPSAKIAPTEGVGCMALLGCILWYSLSHAILK